MKVAMEKPKVSVKVENRVVTEVVEKEVEKTKFGATIDAFLGDVDENGVYVAPTEEFALDLTGVKSLGESALKYKFYESKCVAIIANDLISVDRYAFLNAFSFSYNLSTVKFDSIEEVDKNQAFYYAFCRLSPRATVSFKSLKRISGESAFENAFEAGFKVAEPFLPAEVFPALEEVTGKKALVSAFGTHGSLNHTYPSLKKISGGNAYYYSTFGTPVKNTVYNFPNVTEITGYCWSNASVSGEIHFAAANQAAIEACAGYDYKWGWTGATIYFDL